MTIGLWEGVFILTFVMTILVVPAGLILFISGTWPFHAPEKDPPENQREDPLP